MGTAAFRFLDRDLVEFYYRALFFVALINSREQWRHILPQTETLKAHLKVLVQEMAIAGFRTLTDQVFNDFLGWMGKPGLIFS